MVGCCTNLLVSLSLSTSSLADTSPLRGRYEKAQDVVRSMWPCEKGTILMYEQLVDAISPELELSRSNSRYTGVLPNLPCLGHKTVRILGLWL